MIRGIVAFLAVLWGVYLVDALVPAELTAFGLVPRTLVGLVGVATTPFLHAGFAHLLANSISLFVLLVFLAGTRRRPWQVVAEIVLIGGLLLWLVGRPGNHVGASGLVFGLIVFLILAGFFERRLVPLIVSLAVGFLYGGTLLMGVLPFGAAGVSWDGHLCGALAGAAVARFAKEPPLREAPPAAASMPPS